MCLKTVINRKYHLQKKVKVNNSLLLFFQIRQQPLYVLEQDYEHKIQYLQDIYKSNLHDFSIKLVLYVSDVVCMMYKQIGNQSMNILCPCTISVIFIRYTVVFFQNSNRIENEEFMIIWFHRLVLILNGFSCFQVQGLRVSTF